MEFFLKRVIQNKFDEYSTYYKTMYCFFTGKYENVLRFIPRNIRYMPTLNFLSNKLAGNNKRDFSSLNLLEAIQGITFV